MELKTIKPIKPPKINAKPVKRPLGSIKIEIPDHIRRKTVIPAFISSESLEFEGDFSQKFTDIIELENTFKCLIFFEFFLYHLLFFFIFGPLLPLLCYPFTRSLSRFRNMFFWGFSWNFLSQILLHFLCFSSIFGFFFLNSPNIYKIELFGLLIAVILRISVISVKYASFSGTKLRYFKNLDLTASEIKSEYIFTWYLQTDYSIDKELYTSILKNNVDSSVFRVFFLKDLKPQLIRQLSFDEEEIESPFSSGNSTGKNSNINTNFLTEVFVKSFDLVKKSLLSRKMEESESYSGYLLARFLVKDNRDLQFSIKSIFSLAFLLAFIQAGIPFFFRISSINAIFPPDSMEVLVILCIFFGNLYFNSVNLCILIYGVFEYDRPISLLSQISNLLSTQRVSEYYRKKTLPTVNIFCGVSYKCCSDLNKIFRSYGEKFFKRIEMTLGIFLFYNSFMAILSILAIYGLLGSLNSGVNLAFIAFGMFVMFFTIFLSLRKGAIINEFYDIHRDILKHNKDVISDLVNLYRVYFEFEGLEYDNEIYYMGVTTLMKHFKDAPKEARKSAILEHLNTLINMNNDFIEQLQFSKERRPFKILGIPATNGVIKSLLAGLGTILVAGLQKILANSMKT